MPKMKTPEEVEGIVEKFAEKFNEYIRDVSIGQYNDKGVNIGFKKADVLAAEFIATALTPIIEERNRLREEVKTVYQQGVKDTLAGVPEEKEDTIDYEENMHRDGHNTCRAAVIAHGEKLLTNPKE